MLLGALTDAGYTLDSVLDLSWGQIEAVAESLFAYRAVFWGNLLGGGKKKRGKGKKPRATEEGVSLSAAKDPGAVEASFGALEQGRVPG